MHVTSHDSVLSTKRLISNDEHPIYTQLQQAFYSLCPVKEGFAALSIENSYQENISIENGSFEPIKMR